MTTDPTMRVVWFDGRPFPVSSHPQGLGDPGTHWHVQTADGEWHAVLPRRVGDAEGDKWRGVLAGIVTWLAHRAAGQRDSQE